MPASPRTTSTALVPSRAPASSLSIAAASATRPTSCPATTMHYLGGGGLCLGHADALADELRPRGDAELREDLAQVVLDRARAEEELSGDVLVGVTLADEPRDLQLLRCQVGERARVAPPRGLARCSELGPGALGPRLCPEPLEGVKRAAQVLAGVAAAALATQELPEKQLGAGAVERVRPERVQVERVAEGILGLGARGEQRTAAGGERPRPGGCARAIVVDEARRRGRGLLGATGADGGLHEVRRRDERIQRVTGAGRRVTQGGEPGRRLLRAADAEVKQAEGPLRDRVRDAVTVWARGVDGLGGGRPAAVVEARDRGQPGLRGEVEVRGIGKRRFARERETLFRRLGADREAPAEEALHRHALERDDEAV